jgi:hypothetical protein
MSKTLIGIGVGAVVGVIATFAGIAAAQPSSHHINQSQVYSYSDS